MYNQEKFNQLVNDYKKAFSDRWPEENYKLTAVKHFQENWDINAEDFPSMLNEALAETSNLLMSAKRFPKGMIVGYAKRFPEETKEMFKNLFDETKDLVARINSFINKADEINSKYFEGQKIGQSYQDYNSVSTYLWLMYPDKYYIYKFSEFKAFCNKIGNDFIPKAGKNEDNIIKGYALLDEVSEKLSNDQEFAKLFDGKMTDEFYEDLKYKTRVIDIVRFAYVVDKQVVQNDETVPTTEDTPIADNPNHWWLNANPSYWSFSDFAVGEEQNYTFLNENKNKRRIYQNFLDAKVGDIVVGYESHPMKKIVGLAIITKIDPNERLYFKKVENFVKPIEYNAFKDCEELQNMEYLTNRQGSLFKLTADEYDFIMDMVRESNPKQELKQNEKYFKNDFLKEVYIKPEEYDELKELLANKKNIILKGAPGVGKTFAAKRLAFSIMGEKDESRVKVVQFHQSYAYEDFIMGYKPSEDGFELKTGIFYDFCIEASNHPNKDYFFIIDEINRGNLSKIFGELLMLIENDKRGKEHINLAYNNKSFTVPENLYIIGMMNTADRSLALIDYALRRRFSFYSMAPAFDNPTFKDYQNSLNSDTFNLLIEKIKVLNETIASDNSLGEGFEIGHSYFCNLDGKCNESVLNSIINYDIIPMLEEYWFDDKTKVEEIKKELTEVF